MNIFIHEDFYRQIEFIPEDNFFLIQDKNNTSFLEDTLGFVNATIRPPSVVSLSSKKIHYDTIQDLLLGIDFIYYEDVYKGYGNSAIKMKNTIAYGFERLAIFIEYTEDKYLKAMWLNQDYNLMGSNISIENLIIFVHNLGKHCKLILVDWNEEIAVRLLTVNVEKYLIEYFSFEL